MSTHSSLFAILMARMESQWLTSKAFTKLNSSKMPGRKCLLANSFTVT